jgi:hypothetical protein
MAAFFNTKSILGDWLRLPLVQIIITGATSNSAVDEVSWPSGMRIAPGNYS